jgi:hypothetical protein
MNRLFDFSVEQEVIQVNYRYSLGHSLGESFLSNDKVYSYINIPKNASSAAKEIFHEWTPANFQNVQDRPTGEYIVILRDPTARWISAMAEYLVGKYSTLGPKNNGLDDQEIYKILDSIVFKNLLFDFVVFDGHSLPQCWFLQNLKIDNIKFFYFDETTFDRICAHTNVYKPNNRPVNASMGINKKQIIVKYLKELTSTDPKLQKIIDIHYYSDHKLFDQIKF